MFSDCIAIILRMTSAAAICLFVLLAGCKGENQKRTSGADDTPGVVEGDDHQLDTEPGDDQLEETEIEIGEEPAGMAALKPEDVALSLAGMSVTWREVMEKGRLAERPRADKAARENWARIFLQRIVRRKLLLDEANRRGIQLTDQEKKDYLAKLEKDLKDAGDERSVEEYLSQFPGETASLFDISIDDMLRVAKLVEGVTESITVTDNEMATEKTRLNATQTMLNAKNEEAKKEISSLLAKEEIHTDQGFANLAKAYSQGKEAPGGGVLGVFPRSLIAGLHGLDSFTLNKGETSGLLESDGAFRIVRVLDVIPGEPEEKVKLAQIIYRRLPVRNELTDDQIRAGFKRQKQNAETEKMVMELLKSADVSCPLFPGGLFSSGGDETK